MTSTELTLLTDHLILTVGTPYETAADSAFKLASKEHAASHHMARYVTSLTEALEASNMSTADNLVLNHLIEYGCRHSEQYYSCLALAYREILAAIDKDVKAGPSTLMEFIAAAIEEVSSVYNTACQDPRAIATLASLPSIAVKDGRVKSAALLDTAHLLRAIIAENGYGMTDMISTCGETDCGEPDHGEPDRGEPDHGEPYHGEPYHDERGEPQWGFQYDHSDRSPRGSRGYMK